MPEEPTGPVSAAIPPGSSGPGSGAQAPLAGATPSDAGVSDNNRPAFIFLCLGLAGSLLPSGLQLLGITVNLLLGSVIMVITVGLLAVAFWQTSHSAKHKELIRVLVVLSGLGGLVLTGRQVIRQYHAGIIKDHPSKKSDGPSPQPKPAPALGTPAIPPPPSPITQTKKEPDRPKRVVPTMPAPLPTVVQNNTQGINIGPGATAPNAQVINNGPPEPQLTWEQEQTIHQNNPMRGDGQDGKPSINIRLSVDRSMEVPAFVARCDRPCKTLSFHPMLPFFSTPAGDILSVPTDPTITGINIKTPRPLGAGIRILWEVQAVDASTLRIISVDKIPPDQIRR